MKPSDDIKLGNHLNDNLLASNTVDKREINFVRENQTIASCSMERVDVCKSTD